MPDAAFIVQSFYASDYATQDSEGKQILVGLYADTCYMVEPPPIMPAWYLSVVMRPLKTEFPFILRVGAPNRKTMFRLNFKYKADRVPVPDNRFIGIFQLPIIPFPGFGDYTFRIKDENDQTVFRRVIALVHGQPDKPQVTAEGTADINSDFLPKLPSSITSVSSQG